MSAFELFNDMYDVALKPRLLRTLIREHVPDEKRPFRSSSDLSKVVSQIQTHKLLSESFADSTDNKQVDSWKSAVDDWLHRLMALVSIDSPDKCWTGICLLGLTCQECSPDRFLACYAVWFHKLLSHIQPPADSQFVKVSSCTSISDLLTRLSGFPNAKKDGTSHAGKTIQPVLKLLNEDASEAVWEAAVHLLCTIINFFPASIHRHYDSAEAVIASKISSGKCSVNMLKKLAHCLALLPKSRGDEDSWYMMMQKILLLVNAHLNDVFQGLEEESKGNEAVRSLVLPGKDPPSPLGGHSLSGEALDKTTKGSEQLLMSSISTLIHCCCTMLTSSYPVQVTVPIRSLLALVERVLMVDGSIPHTMPFMTVMQQELICSELPVLHLYSLELLTAIIKGMRSQLLPHAAYIVRLVKQYFKRCALPELRIKVYSIVRVLLISMGVGIAIYLSQEVVNNAILDLKLVGDQLVNSKASSEALLQPSNRKRKHNTTIGSLGEQHDKNGLEVEGPKNHPTIPISVKIAALEALEALLTVGGALRSESWRSEVDLLLITTATDSCKGGWACEGKNTFLLNEPTSSWADLQLAALRALFASLLSPARVRPPYLAQGLELFRRGKQETGTKLSEFCAHALLALEVLIHPRALPLADFPTANSSSIDGVNRRFLENIYSAGQKHSTPFSSGLQGMGHDASESDEDDLYDRWLGNGNETEAPLNNPGKNRVDSVKPSETSRVHWAEKLSVAGSSVTKTPERSDQKPGEASADVGTSSNQDEIMVERQQFQESMVQFQGHESLKGASIPAFNAESKGAELEYTMVASDSGALDYTDHKMASHEDILADKGDGFATAGGNTSTTTSTAEKGKATVLDWDDDSSMDSFPDIVEADPDSD